MRRNQESRYNHRPALSTARATLFGRLLRISAEAGFPLVQGGRSRPAVVLLRITEFFASIAAAAAPVSAALALGRPGSDVARPTRRARGSPAHPASRRWRARHAISALCFVAE
jgi:hypothetical protein